MENQELRNQLERLKSELSNVNAASDSDRAILAELSADIDRTLARNARDREHERGFADRLRDAASRFEAEHSGATMLMGELAAGLANLGL